MKKKLRFLALLLALCLLTTGCAGPASGPGPSASTDTDVEYTDVLAGLQQAADTGLDQYTETFERPVLQGGRVWALGTGWVQASAADEPQLADVVISANTDGSDPQRLALVMPEAWADSEEWGSLTVYPTALLPTADGALRLLCRLEWIHAEQDDIHTPSHTEYRLATLEQDGTLADETAPEGLTDKGAITAVAAIPGTAWLLSGQCVIRMDPVTGKCESHPAPDDSHLSTLQPLADGSLLLMGTKLLNNTAETGSWLLNTDGSISDMLPTPPQFNLLSYSATATPVLPGDTVPDTPLLWGGDALFRWDIQAGTAEPLFSWLDSGINAAALLHVFQLEQDKYLLVSRADEGGALSFITLVPASPELLANRTVITVGITGDISPRFKEAVLRFNGANDKVFAKVVQYALIEGDEGVDQLEKDILAWQAPDVILLTRSMSNNSYIRQGLYMDMYPLLDADPELKRTDFVPNILKTGEFNSALTTIPVSYDIFTAAGVAAKVGTEPGWTFEEYNAVAAAEKNLKHMFYWVEQQSFLLYTMQMAGKRFVDYEAGVANLNTPEMAQLLEASAAYPLERTIGDTKQLFDEGQYLLYMDMMLNGFDVLREYQYIFDGDYTFVGFPGNEGCGSAIIPDVRVGITTHSQNPEAAWQFVRTLLLPTFQDSLCTRSTTSDWQNRPAFPLREDSLQKAAEASARPFTADTPLRLIGVAGTATVTGGGSDYWSKGIPAEQSQKVLDLIHSITATYQYDDVLTGILFEEAAAYYNGVRSAQQTVEIMQNRIQTYLNEQG